MKIFVTNKLVHRYLPLTLSVVLIAVSGFVYLIYTHSLNTEAAFANGYSYRRTISIDYTKVPNTDQSDFPVVVMGNYSFLATAANGGQVQNSNGYDVAFYSDAAGTSIMAWEIEKYTAASGTVAYWVKVSSVSHTANTEFYMFYGNSSITTNQSNTTGTWNSAYKGVWHLPDGTTLTANDSTGTNNGTLSGSPTAQGGVIDGSAFFAGGFTYYIDAGTNSSLDISNNTLTLEAWAQRGTTSTTGTIVSKGKGGNSGYTMSIGVSPCTTNQIKLTKFGVVDICIGSFPADTSWHHLVATFNGGSGETVYIDGVSNATSADTANIKTTTFSFDIGYNHNQPEGAWAGFIDEPRMSNSARSADWVKTEYNNQNSPSTFYTVSGESVSNASTAPVTVRGGVKVRSGVKFR